MKQYLIVALAALVSGPPITASAFEHLGQEAEESVAGQMRRTPTHPEREEFARVTTPREEAIFGLAHVIAQYSSPYANKILLKTYLRAKAVDSQEIINVLKEEDANWQQFIVNTGDKELAVLLAESTNNPSLQRQLIKIAREMR